MYLFERRLYLEAPLITEDAVEALKMVSSDETRGLAPLQLLKEMVIRRPTKQLVFLNVLLCHTGHENSTVSYFILFTIRGILKNTYYPSCKYFYFKRFNFLSINR